MLRARGLQGLGHHPAAQFRFVRPLVLRHVFPQEAAAEPRHRFSAPRPPDVQDEGGQGWTGV
eukprot:8529356-Lingulodinium_polyedra.AAC.1